MLGVGRFALLLSLVGSLACGREGLPDPDAEVGDADTDGGATDRGMVVDSSIKASRVIDGDTIVLAAGAGARAPDGTPLQGVTVRLIGINAPEISHEGSQAECWSAEATQALRNLVLGPDLELEYGSDLRDIYGRVLAYIRLPNGDVANETMVAEGHALSFREFRHQYTTLYNRLESEARVAQKGLWGNCP